MLHCVQQLITTLMSHVWGWAGNVYQSILAENSCLLCLETRLRREGLQFYIISFIIIIYTILSLVQRCEGMLGTGFKSGTHHSPNACKNLFWRVK